MVLPSLLLVSLGLGAISLLGTEQIVAKGERGPRYANLAKRAEAEALPHVSHAQGVETLFFSQKLDHFDASSTTVFSQRYYVNTQYYAEGGPIFVYIGGEGAMGAGSVSSGEIVANAKIHSGAVIGLEHRYYGVSHPFNALTTANLRWLSSQQALADLSNWIDFIRGDRGWKNNKIFTFGGSYPGALSAWFRLKYPNVTEGSVASSAPVLALADYYQYDQTVAAGVGAQCADQIRKGNALIESLLASQPDQIKARFGCEAVKDPVGFLYVLADAVAYAIQYTSERAGPRYHLREMLCDHMAGADPVEGYIAFFNQLMGLLKTTCPDFTTTDDTLADVTVGEDLAQRQWYYQSCMEFGYFQTAPRVKPLRSSKIDLGFHIELCKRAFGPSVAGPDVEKTNAYYGGNHTKSSKIYFPNGSVDPWHVLSVQYPLSCCPTIVPLIINGTSHCADLYEATSADPASLVAARADITRKISDWLA